MKTNGKQFRVEHMEREREREGEGVGKKMN